MAKIQVTTESGTHTLYFGMTAIGIWQKKCADELIRVAKGDDINDESVKSRVDNLRALAFLIYAGICNASDLKEDGERPEFEDAYLIADSLSHDQQNEVWNAFQNSRAGSELLARLPKSEGEKKSQSVKRVTKTKSQPTQS